MPIGTERNADATLTRNQLIAAAYRKLGLLVGQITTDQLLVGVETLNLILREESGRMTGQNRALWATKRRVLKLVAGQSVYDSGDGLATDIHQLAGAAYRSTSGTDTALTLLTPEGYDALEDKDDSGDPTVLALIAHRDLDSQQVRLHPILSSAGTTSEVVGTDGENYICAMAHTSADQNRPITGTDWPLYWDQQGSSGSTWVTDTDYTNGALVTYTYERPLYDFDNATDNPDFPLAWTRYLILRLALDLSADYAIAIEERQWLEREALRAREDIFPSQRVQTSDFHHKHLFY